MIKNKTEICICISHFRVSCLLLGLLNIMVLCSSRSWSTFDDLNLLFARVWCFCDSRQKWRRSTTDDYKDSRKVVYILVLFTIIRIVSDTKALSTIKKQKYLVWLIRLHITVVGDGFLSYFHHFFFFASSAVVPPHQWWCTRSFMDLYILVL